jgi:hypothetical protein
MKLLTIGMLWAASLMAAPVLSLDPAGGALTGAPAGTVGWGFALTPDATEWIAFTGSFLLTESNPSLGFYGDLIGTQGGPSGGLLPPAPQPNWVQSFDLNLLTGLGYYSIDPFAAPGAVNSGIIRILYERFSDAPNTCGDCYLGSGELDAAFSVTVADNAVPESSTWLLLPAGIFAMLAKRRQM